MITLENINEVIKDPQFDSLKFDIPDSITGLKREATFIELQYYTADEKTKQLRDELSFLKVKFHVRHYSIQMITPEPISEYNEETEEYELIPQEPVGTKVFFPLLDTNDEFIADYKTFVNAVNGQVIASPKDNNQDIDGVIAYLNKLISDGIYTEEQLLNGTSEGFMLTNQIKYFEMLFNKEENNGMIPVKQLIQSFALNAKWKDIETKN